MTESRVAKTPSVEEALRRLTNRVSGTRTSGIDDPTSEARIAIDDHRDLEDLAQPQDREELGDRSQSDESDEPEDFEDIDDNIDLNITTHRYVKLQMNGQSLVDREPDLPTPAGLPVAADQFTTEPMFAPVVDVDVLMAALHGGDDEPLRRLSAIAIASEREAILASAKAEALLLVSEARSHQRSILAQAESKAEIMIARAEAQAASTLARAEARAQLLELESHNRSILVSSRKKRKQR